MCNYGVGTNIPPKELEKKLNITKHF